VNVAMATCITQFSKGGTVTLYVILSRTESVVVTRTRIVIDSAVYLCILTLFK
jgi:hypothetical protein